jgi:hypothetical protein
VIIIIIIIIIIKSSLAFFPSGCVPSIRIEKEENTAKGEDAKSGRTKLKRVIITG